MIPWNDRRSIRSHFMVGMLTAGALVGGIGGWAGTAELAGAVIARGVVVVEFRSEESAASHRRHCWRTSRGK